MRVRRQILCGQVVLTILGVEVLLGWRQRAYMKTNVRATRGQSPPRGIRGTPAHAPLVPDGVKVSRRKKAQRLANGEHRAAAMLSKCSSRPNPQPPLRCERWKPSAPACGDRCGERDKRLQSRLPRLPPRDRRKAACYP